MYTSMYVCMQDHTHVNAHKCVGMVQKCIHNHITFGEACGGKILYVFMICAYIHTCMHIFQHTHTHRKLLHMKLEE
jgi:hypothetical protein